jgi:site-specific DNA recombinase
MKRVAGYARVSTLAQVSEGTSLEDQKAKIQDWCTKEKYELINIYTDGGVSGGSLERPQLQRLLADAKEGEFDGVVFTKLDRLGRDNRDLYNLYHELKNERGVDVLCIEDPSLNTGGRMGKMFLGMLGTVAEFERDTIRERTSGGRKIKWKERKAIIGELPLGYRKKKKPRVK